MPHRFRTWQDDRARRIETEKSDSVSCHTFYRWVRRAVAGYIVLCIAFAGNSLIDRSRATEGRRALAASGNVVSIVGCNRDFRLYQKVRAVFQQSLAFATQQHQQGLTTDSQYQRSRNFYETQLSNFPLPDCRKVANVLTDSSSKADDQVPPPAPLYRGSPEEDEVGFDPNPNEGRARPVFPRGG